VNVWDRVLGQPLTVVIEGRVSSTRPFGRIRRSVTSRLRPTLPLSNRRWMKAQGQVSGLRLVLLLMVIGDDVYLIVHTAWENVAIQERQKTECVEQMRPIQAQEALGAQSSPSSGSRASNFSADMRRGELAMTVRRSNKRPSREHGPRSHVFARKSGNVARRSRARRFAQKGAKARASQLDNWFASP
jgi:hypothetical protein